jgi:biopolymer transport protein ExbB/TolQ
MFELTTIAPLLAQVSGIERVTTTVGNVIYFFLALTAIWGGFCIALAWMRVGWVRFPNEASQDEFLAHVEEPLLRGDFEQATRACADDPRATPQLALLALKNRHIGYSRVRQLVLDRFQRDVLTDLDHRLSWVNTCIKGAPMLGLLGTVMGMMGAFGKLAAAENVKPEALAGDIMLALITTAIGLAIAIPLVFCLNSINVRISKLEDLVSAGMTRFLESFRDALARTGNP